MKKTGMSVLGETPCIHNNKETSLYAYIASLYAAIDWLYHQKPPPRALFYLYFYYICIHLYTHTNSTVVSGGPSEIALGVCVVDFLIFFFFPKVVACKYAAAAARTPVNEFYYKYIYTYTMYIRMYNVI